MFEIIDVSGDGDISLPEFLWFLLSLKKMNADKERATPAAVASLGGALNGLGGDGKEGVARANGCDDPLVVLSLVDGAANATDGCGPAMTDALLPLPPGSNGAAATSSAAVAVMCGGGGDDEQRERSEREAASLAELLVGLRAIGLVPLASLAGGSPVAAAAVVRDTAAACGVAPLLERLAREATAGRRATAVDGAALQDDDIACAGSRASRRDFFSSLVCDT